MRILVLGGDGMLGHQLFHRLSLHHEVRVTLRRDLAFYDQYGMFTKENAYGGIDLRFPIVLEEKVLENFCPEAVINCAGIIKQHAQVKESIPNLEINALLPHRLSVICKLINARFLHFSTDCVFSGKKGNYREDDVPDAEDLYGRTKFLGEVYDSHCLTLRTSIVGPELSRKKSLLEWFLSQKGRVQGYTNAIFSGFTTIEMGRIVDHVLVNHPDASGIYHVSSEPINKYDLLHLFREKFKHDIQIESDATFCCDRSLDSGKFRRKFDYTPPSWEEMVDELPDMRL